MVDKNLVWYVGFGSNIYRERFLSYITGGQPTGSQKTYEGCRDNSLPKDDKPTTINYELYFAKISTIWGNGGVGFINIDENNKVTTYARMYLITRQQLADIAKQETNSSEYLNINFDNAISNGNTIFKTPSWYGKLLYFGDNNGHPIFTLTNESNLTDSTKPSAEYLRTIIIGIQQTHKLTNQEIANYLIDKRGVNGNYTADELQNLFGD